MFSGERTIKPHFQHADLFAARQQFIHHFFTGADGRTHQHDHAFRLRMAIILERFVLPSGGGGERIHRLFNMVVNRVVPRVGRFARLEIGIRVCRGSANHRMFRIEGASTVRIDLSLWQKSEDRIVSQRNDFVDFVRCAEPIKEMNKRHAAFQRRDMRNQREVLCLLDAAGAQHGAARLTDRHHVGVIAKDGEGVSRDRTRGDMQHKWRQLSG